MYVIVKLAHCVNEMSYNKHNASGSIVFDDASNGFSYSPVVSSRDTLQDISICLLHGPDSGQPFICELQSSRKTKL